MTINKETVRKNIIERTETAMVERELMLDYLTKMKDKAEKENQPAFDMELDKLKKMIESDKNFLKEF